MRRDELSDLMVFLAVAEEGTFTRAALRLGVSQSAVSHAIRRLEESLGFRLLNRTSRSVSLTDLGEKLLASLRPGFAQIESRIEELRGLRGSPAGVIRITTSMAAARHILWPVASKLVDDYPDIQIEINTNARIADLAEGRFDAAIRLAEAVPPDLIAVPVGPQVQMAIVGSPEYIAARGIPQTPDDLDHHNCINMRFGSDTPIYEWEFDKDGRQFSRKVHGALTFNESELCLDAARDGYGLCYVGLAEVEAEIATGRLIRVLADWCEPFDGFQICYSSRRQMSAALRLLIDRLRYRG